MNENQSLTEGSIWKKMLLFALPVMLGNIFQQFYNTFDAWTVGNFLDGDSLAAVSSSGSLIFMMVSFFSGLAMGAGVVIARSYGARDYETMSKTIHTAVAFGLVSGSFLTVFGTALSPTILGWMGTPAEIMPKSVIESEVASYRAHAHPYGLPLDNRQPYTKSDWLIWTATLAGNRDTFEDMVAPLWDAYNSMLSRVPATDWYYTITGQHKAYNSSSEKVEKSFRNRTVVGGHFIKLLEYKGIMKL